MKLRAILLVAAMLPASSAKRMVMASRPIGLLTDDEVDFLIAALGLDNE
jgi:hypothetical protein